MKRIQLELEVVRVFAETEDDQNIVDMYIKRIESMSYDRLMSEAEALGIWIDWNEAV